MAEWVQIILGISCLATAIWLLWKRRQMDGDLRQKGGELMDPAQMALSRASASAMTAQMVFDESRILADLVALADQPGAVARYIERWKKRSLTTGQVDLLNQWERLYNSATTAIEAKTKLRRAQSEYQQLEAEDEISRREKEVRLAELDTQREEALLRREEVRLKREQLRAPNLVKSDYEQQMDAAWEKEKVNLLWEIRQRQGKRVASQEALTQWFNDELARIHRTDRLTPAQQTELVQALQREYETEKERIRQQLLTPDEEPGPEENLFTN